MVASAFLEPSESTLPSSCSSNLELASPSTFLQDTWNNAPESALKVPDVHSISKTTSIESSRIIKVDKDTRLSDSSEEEFEEMISEEIVITSEDLFLTDAWCGSECSEYDSDDRNSDQGYESIDSPSSVVCENDTLSELFPNLM